MGRTIYPPYPKRLENLIFCRCLGVICRFPPLIKIIIIQWPCIFSNWFATTKSSSKRIHSHFNCKQKVTLPTGPSEWSCELYNNSQGCAIWKIEGKLNLWSLSAQHMICMKKGKIFQSYESKSWLPGTTRLCYSTALTQTQTIVFLLKTVKWCR